jgi:DNA-binding response OmpR family regulator
MTRMSTALITDDDRDIRFLLSSVLERAGFEVAEAENGREALSYLRAHEMPDIAILDIQMPHMDGWETLSRIRSDPRMTALPVILCTAKSSADNEARGWKLGADGYVAKPFQASDLLARVRGVLTRNDDQRAFVRPDPPRS